MRQSRTGARALALGLTLAIAAPAMAQPQDPMRSFEAAEKAFAAGDRASACAGYEQLAGGADRGLPWKQAFVATTKLALCKRDAGKLASAVALYRAAAEILRTNGRGSNDYARREAEAERVAAELAAKVSRLTIIVPTASRLDGMTVELAGAPLTAEQWNQSLELDGGDYAIVVSAPGHQPFQTTVTLAAEADRKQVEVPALAADAPVDSHVPDPALEPTPPIPARAPAAEGRGGLGGMRLAAIVAGGVGVVALGGGLGLELSARGTYADYEDDPAHPDSLLDDANGKRDLANLGLGVGLAALAGGATLWLLGGRSETSADDGVSITPILAPGTGGASATVRF